jgi:predicted N-formylglutamate amidohydrolase
MAARRLRRRAAAPGASVPRPLHVIVSCEHGGNRVPAAYARWFAHAATLLASHRGYDPGALAIGRILAARLHAPFYCTTVSRLVVEQNRSPGHRQLFSTQMRSAPAAVREDALKRYYLPYHRAVVADVEQAIAAGARVLHVSAHSFAPVLRGDARRTDLGLLYDPAHGPEAAFCRSLQAALRAHTGRVVRLNYPYRGTSDGFTTRLRQRHAAADYLGMELEVNQRLVRTAGWPRLRDAIAAGFAAAVGALAASPPRGDGSARVAGVTRPRAARERAPRSPAARPARDPRAATPAGR